MKANYCLSSCKFIS